MAEEKPNKPTDPVYDVLVTSLVSHRNMTPRVDVRFLQDKHIQMEAEAAIKVGVDLIRVATGAYADSFLFNFLLERVFKARMDDSSAKNACAQILQEFRAYRDELIREFLDRQIPEL